MIIKNEFKDKTLLITGGTGSFGNTVVKYFINSNVKEIRIFSRDEKKQEDMRIKYNNSKLKFYIGDVRNMDSVNNVMIGVDFVFNAAALKQVPSCEFFPKEATDTNVYGTLNVIRSARLHKVKSVVCLSTDKAAYPINAMGISKALMEKCAIAEARNINDGYPIVTVTRYGNVMASRGSVIPLFINQAKAGKDLTITDPSMTRYLMSLDEAVDLVLFAFLHGKQGDLFVQKADTSTIGDLASAIKKMYNPDINIKIMGRRHGEKLHETLLTKEEYVKAEDLNQYFRVPADNRDLNYAKYLNEGDLLLLDDKVYDSKNANMLTVDGIIKKLESLSYLNEAL